jgi:hypothetical protein
MAVTLINLFSVQVYDGGNADLKLAIEAAKTK